MEKSDTVIRLSSAVQVGRELIRLYGGVFPMAFGHSAVARQCYVQHVVLFYISSCLRMDLEASIPYYPPAGLHHDTNSGHKIRENVVGRACPNDYAVILAILVSLQATIKSLGEAISIALFKLESGRFSSPSQQVTLRQQLKNRLNDEAVQLIATDTTLDSVLGHITDVCSTLRQLKTPVQTVEGLKGPEPVVDLTASILTEAESLEPQLKFLPIILSGLKVAPAGYPAEALLDTGATSSCISEDLALHLKLPVKRVDDKVEWSTALCNTKMYSKGTTKLRFEWKDASGTINRAKVPFHVIANLSTPLILSLNFTLKYPGVWEVSKMAPTNLDNVLTLGFNRLSKAERVVEEQKRRDRSQKNQREDEENTKRLIAELCNRLQRVPVRSSASSGATQTTTGVASSTSGGSRT